MESNSEVMGRKRQEIVEILSVRIPADRFQSGVDNKPGGAMMCLIKQEV
jgi:hypothetical protein